MDQEPDVGAGEVGAEADVVQAAGAAQGDAPVVVDLVFADAEVAGLVVLGGLKRPRFSAAPMRVAALG